MKTINKNTIVKFKRTGNLYLVLECECKMKHPETREWISSVIYRGYKVKVADGYIDDPEKKVWVRELKDFQDKFEVYDDNDYPDLSCRTFFETPDSIFGDCISGVDLNTLSEGEYI